METMGNYKEIGYKCMILILAVDNQAWLRNINMLGILISKNYQLMPNFFLHILYTEGKICLTDQLLQTQAIFCSLFSEFSN